jgi:hypothetical protein
MGQEIHFRAAPSHGEDGFPRYSKVVSFVGLGRGIYWGMVEEIEPDVRSDAG